MAREPTDATRTAESAHEAEPRLFAFWPGGAASIDAPPAGTEITIGRDATNALRIDHASVSRAHAVVRGGDPLSIQDLGSHNGTVVGERRLGKGEHAPIPRNQVVKLGSATLILQGGETTTPANDTDAAIDPPMREALRLLDVVAKSDMSVILGGETGVGKEVLATRLHERSPRAKGAFVRLSCAALADSLLESELFGYERGAFTGALAAKPGLFEAADGGTIFLDEIGEISATTQVKLLRVLENREVMRVGALKPRVIDVRVVAATHRDLPARVASGEFREDLYFRLNGITIAIPPLRERRSEIVPLAVRFARDACARGGRAEAELSSGARDRLLAHDWPGNVRELKTTIERAVVLCQGARIEPEHVTLSAPRATSAPSSPALRAGRDTQPVMQAASSLPDAVNALEKQRIEDALRACDGNQTAAAKMLGISRRTLVYRLGALGLRK